MAGSTTLAKKFAKVNGRPSEGHNQGTIFLTSWDDLCETSCVSVAAFPVANRARGTRAGYRLGHEFCTALPAFFAIHRSRIPFDRLTSRGWQSNLSGKPRFSLES